jgi:hypothetical protein
MCLDPNLAKGQILLQITTPSPPDIKSEQMVKFVLQMASRMPDLSTHGLSQLSQIWVHAVTAVLEIVSR